ncbi:hypothetical protein GCM10027180_31930 [Microbulbifer echini]
MPLLLASGAWINREGAPVILVVGLAVIPIIMGILLWIYAPKIADKKISSSVKDDAISEGGLVVAGVFLIGVYWALKSVGIILSQFLNSGTVDYGYVSVLLISVFLILGGKFITNMYHKLRTAGTGV